MFQRPKGPRRPRKRSLKKGRRKIPCTVIKYGSTGETGGKASQAENLEVSIQWSLTKGDCPSSDNKTE